MICGLNWLFHPWGGALEFSIFKIGFCAKEFRFFGLRVHCSLRIFFIGTWFQGPRSKLASFRVGGLKKNAWRKIVLLKYFFCLIYFYSCKKMGGGAKAPPAPPSARSLGFPFLAKILECLMGFGFDLWCGFRIFLFGFWFLFDQSGHYAPPLTSKSRETSVCCTCQLCIGSIKVLRTGIWTFICFDGFACGFRFLIEFLLVSNRPSHGF